MSAKRKAGAPSHAASTSAKRAKVVDAPVKPKMNFHTAADIRHALQSQSADELRDVLVALRGLFSLKHEESIVPQDARLVLAKAWLDSQSGADIFSVWETAIRQHWNVVQHLPASLLATLLNLLSTHFIYHALGYAIIKTLLSPTWLRRLNAGVASGQNDVVLATMKLWVAMSEFGGGRERATIMKSFNWSLKTLPRLLSMRRKGKAASQAIHPLHQPDIRTLYLCFILSFVSPSSPPPLKATFLEEHRDIFWSMFKGLKDDPYEVGRRVLETCWEGIWCEVKLKRTLKVACFTETTLGQITKLYESSEDGLLDVAHHFLLAICTRPGTGLCFRDRGWYPRERDATAEEDDDKKKQGKIYNKVLAGIVKTLKVNDDARQQELALRILGACPELVQSYWPAASLTLEPRLASKWLINMSFVSSVASLPVPAASFYIPGTTTFNPAPPPLSSILESTMPTSSLGATLTKALKSPSSLVQHTAALTLSRCLDKVHRVLSSFADVARALEEGSEGQWTQRAIELARAARTRVPDFQVVVAFVLQHLNAAATGDESTRTRTQLLSEAGLRVMWLYHLALPGVVSEARFDVGKILGIFAEGAETDKLLPIRQLHVLRILPLSNQFAWSAKLSSTGKTPLHAILALYLSSPSSQPSSSSFLISLVGGSVLFSHDPSEFSLWLAALPSPGRAPGSKGMGADGEAIELRDECTAVLDFLDDCVLRCLKTPYRYLDDLSLLSGDGVPPRAMPSPLLATILEQLAAKDMGPSDALSLFTFTRQLAFSLAGKTAIKCVRAITTKMNQSLGKVDRCVIPACRREVALLGTALDALEGLHDADDAMEEGHASVQSFFDSLDLQPDPADAIKGRATAVELIDWYRLVDISLSSSEISRLRDAVERFSEDTVPQLMKFLPPSAPLFSANDPTLRGLPFAWAFVHATPSNLRDPALRQQLIDTILTVAHDCDGILHAAQFVLHRLSSSRGRDESSALAYVSFLASIARHGRGDKIFPTNSTDLQPLKQLLFVESPTIAALARSVNAPEIEELVDALLNPALPDDSAFAADICAHWVAAATKSQDLVGAFPWIRFMNLEQLVVILRAYINVAPDQYAVLQATIEQLCSRPLEDRIMDELNILLPDLLRLVGDDTSDQLLALILKLVSYNLPLGCYGLNYHPINSKAAEDAWSHRTLLPTPGPTQAHTFASIQLTKQTAEITAAIVYRFPSLRTVILAQLVVEEAHEDLLPVLHALLDVAVARQSLTFPVDFIQSWLKRLVSIVCKRSASRRSKSLAVESLDIIASIWPNVRANLCKRLNEQVAKHAGLVTDASLLEVVGRLVQRWPEDFEELASDTVNHSLQALVRHYVEVKEDSSIDLTPTFTLVQLAKHAHDVKPQFVDPFMVAAIQYRLAAPSAMRFATVLVERVPLKPVNTNRYLQSVIQHAQINVVAGSSDPEPTSTRLPVVALIHALFHKHPGNASQPTHMGPLLRLFTGSPQHSDRLLLSIFKLYEVHRNASAGSFLIRWTGTQGGSPSSRALHALASMDAARVFRSCTPLSHLKLLDFSVHYDDARLYDPVFVVLLLGQALIEASSYSALEWVELFRTNAVCVALCLLSYRDRALRMMTLTVLDTLWSALQTATFLERDQTVHVLDLLRDVIPPPSKALSDNGDYPERIPLYTTLLLAHALRGIFYPSSPMYPIALRFLLQRPALDTRDVPLLYGMLYSATEDWRREQGWMVRFLAEGFVGELEWRVMKRRHTWDLVASLFDSASEAPVRLGVLSVLANLTSCKPTVASLVLKSQLLAWIELHMHGGLRDGEDVPFVKILENIVCALDADKVERTTGGAWRAGLGRCIGALILQTANFGVLHIASRILLRLSLLSIEQPLPLLPHLLENAATALKRLDTYSTESTTRASIALPPHRSTNLTVLVDDTRSLYAETVEMLWRACLTCETRPAAWDTLTPRLLVLPKSEVTDWARRMVVASLE